MNNFERIKTMTLEEMARELMGSNVRDQATEKACKNECNMVTANDFECPHIKEADLPCHKCMERWLMKEVDARERWPGMRIKLDEWTIMPTRAHKTDAGLDIYAGEDVLIMPGDHHTFDTGVHVALPEGTVGLIKSRSGMNINRSLVCEGVIDAGYTGSIRVKLYNLGSHAQRISKEDRIAQLVILHILVPEPELADDLEETERGGNGFGSSGR